MKKLLTTALVIAIVATLINDVGRYARASYDLGVIAQDTADHIALSGKLQDRNTNATAAAAFAAMQGATVYLYDQDDRKVYVWAEMPVEGTWLWAPVAVWRSGEPKGSPFKIQVDHATFWK